MKISFRRKKKNKPLAALTSLFSSKNKTLSSRAVLSFNENEKLSAEGRGKHSSRFFDLDQERKIKRRRRLKKVGLIAGFLALITLLIGGLVFWQGDLLSTLLSPISFVARLVNPVKLKETDGRVNALILGLDTRASGGLLNTDTVLVGSFSLTDGDPVLIAIPRDLLVSFATGGRGKINSAYALGAVQSNGKIDEQKGVEAAKTVVEKVLGIPLHYWVLVSFDGFKEVIDTLGGIEVCVERTFDDWRYPVQGKEKAPLSQRYEHLHFDKGCQKMSGERALKYSRSRMGTAGEGSDFARIRRQQKVILAVKDKILSLSLLFNPGKIVKLYNQLTKTIKTNASLAETQRALELLYDFQDLTEVQTLVLDPESKLTYVPQNRASYGGAYVILPKGGSFDTIHKAVRELLFGLAEKAKSE